MIWEEIYSNGLWKCTILVSELIDGGNYGNPGDLTPASVRYSNLPTTSDAGIGFRLTLYIR